jgi:hypothetical protein
MVVDALDLCYTKAHVDSFVIISGDSDFSPLVSKLRENDKYVIGIGVRAATSDLLAANCDEFIYYDDLVREQEAKRKRAEKKAPAKATQPKAKKLSAKVDEKVDEKVEEKAEDRNDDDRRHEGLDLLVETLEALIAERGEDEKIWGSMVKQTMKRRKPGFSESAYGYRSFREMVEDAEKRKLLVVARDEKSGQYLLRPSASEEQG